MTDTDGVIEVRKSEYKKEHLITKNRKILGFYCVETDQVQLMERVSCIDLKKIAAKVIAIQIKKLSESKQ